jgi:peptidoglycan/xylan/chitin deacetylase (PgdA/CDA1 family)
MKKLLSTVIGILLMITLVSCTDSSSTETTSESHTGSTETTLLSDENETSENDPEESKSEESEPETTPADSETESESLPESSETVTESTTTPQESVSEPVSAEPQPTLYAPRVMMYHLISNNLNGTNNSLYVRPTEFEEHLILLNELGFEYIFADEWRYTENPSVALTFDDGYVDNYTVMFPLLKQYNAKATIFVITNLIGTDGYLTADMIREMSDSGFVSIQCHTVNHYNLNQIDVNTMRNEFKISSDVIKSLTGKDVKALAYPMGMFNSTVISVAGEYFDFAYTTDSPFYVWEYTTYNIPRYFVRRNDGRYRFYNYLK